MRSAESLPAPAKTTSSPLNPLMASAPPPPQMTSLPWLPMRAWEPVVGLPMVQVVAVAMLGQGGVQNIDEDIPGGGNRSDVHVAGFDETSPRSPRTA